MARRASRTRIQAGRGSEPARPWRWALLVGLWIPAINVARHRNFGSVLALAFCLVGAYLGALAGRLAKRAAGAA